MHPEMIRAVMNQWTQTEKSQQDKLLARFIQDHGEVYAQRDWLLYLADAFDLDHHHAHPPTPGFFEH